ncbi:MAG: 50S ribosomal protein L3 [Deltaproteobacteria bacterium]|nr:MAG: 50S ribosomal protein L3 [Deltaproteobacteria bacterium]
MNKGILGRKVGMTQIFDEAGNRIPVTVVEAEPNLVVGLRTPEKDGYAAVQLGFGAVKEKHLTRPMKGHFEKAGVEPRRTIREIRLAPEELEGVQVGQEVRVDIFEVGTRVDVTGITLGKGFQGVMKRHGMAGMRATHGTHEARRNPGSIGNRKTPGRTFPNKRLPGHMGHRRVTTQNLTIVGVEPEHHLLLIRGPVPGAKGTILTIRRAVKGQRNAA